MEIINMSRREFIKTGAAAGGGLLLGFSFFSSKLICEASTSSQAFGLNAFIRVSTDNTVTLIMNKSEMGQGVYTSLPMLIAEELECDWSKIRVESAPVDPAFNHTQWGIQGTGGSTSVWSEWDRLRKVGATARMMLIAAAAETWKVDPSTCRAEKGFVLHGPSQRKLSFGKLAEKASHGDSENWLLKQEKDLDHWEVEATS
jgi:isoquinoline 1-oxidoreductase beta subunit